MSGRAAIRLQPPTHYPFCAALAGYDDADWLDHFRRRRTPKIPCFVDGREASDAALDGVMDGRFTFNGEVHDLPGDVDWRRNPSRDTEWLILLNKFYYAPGLARRFAETGDQRVAQRLGSLMESWIDAGVEPGFIAADVTGRRVQNWVYALIGVCAAPTAPELPPSFISKALRSLDGQVAWLVEHLHPARNHRTLELYAVLLASLAFPELAASSHRLTFAVNALEENAVADFRVDGGHCEQSTHYHCIVLANFLNAVSLLRSNGLSFPVRALERLRAASYFAARLHRPDGDIPALSDADGGSHLSIVRQAATLFDDMELAYWASAGAEGARRTPENRMFAESGYVVFTGSRSGDAWEDRRFLVFDCGPLGEGNHGHFDALSIEAFAYGRPLIVDPGRFTYDEGGPVNCRAAFRETRAHSTIEVDGKNQVRYEDGPRSKRVRGPEPRIEDRFFGEREGIVFAGATAVSDQYDAVHRRRILFVENEFWVVIDDLFSTTMHDYALRYQFNAGAALAIVPSANGLSTRATAPGISICLCGSTFFTAAAENRFTSRAYGQRSAAPMLRCSAQGANYRWTAVLFPWRDAPPAPSAVVAADGRLIVAFRDAGAVQTRRIDITDGREAVIKRDSAR